MISEYGILLSQYHGFPHSVVRNYMLASFDFMLNTKDSATGYPADDYRLVQQFAWFSLNYYEFDLKTYIGLNGNLFDHSSRQIMPLGIDFANYTNQVTVRTIDLAVKSFGATPATVNGGEPVTLQAAFVNSGGIAAEGVTVRFYAGDPRAQGQLLGSSSLIAQVLPGCEQTQNASLVWTPSQASTYNIFAELVATNQNLDGNSTNNYANQPVNVLTSITATATPTTTTTATATPTQPTPTATATLLLDGPTHTPTAMPTLLPDGPTHTPTATPTLLPDGPTHTPTPTATLDPRVPTPTLTGTTTPVAQGGGGQKRLYLPLITR